MIDAVAGSSASYYKSPIDQAYQWSSPSLIDQPMDCFDKWLNRSRKDVCPDGWQERRTSHYLAKKKAEGLYHIDQLIDSYGQWLDRSRKDGCGKTHLALLGREEGGWPSGGTQLGWNHQPPLAADPHRPQTQLESCARMRHIHLLIKASNPSSCSCVMILFFFLGTFES